jgi:ElaB/YqjD/DUF883 family membrane-anchored ribosome-binding protein
MAASPDGPMLLRPAPVGAAETEVAMSSSKNNHNRRPGNTQGDHSSDYSAQGGDIAAQAQSTVDAVSAAASRVGDQVSDAFDQAREAGGRAVRQASKAVEDYPMHSVGIAFGVGLVVGIILDRIL